MKINSILIYYFWTTTFNSIQCIAPTKNQKKHRREVAVKFSIVLISFLDRRQFPIKIEPLPGYGEHGVEIVQAILYTAEIPKRRKGMPLLRTFMAEGLSVTIFRKVKDKGDADNIVVYTHA